VEERVKSGEKEAGPGLTDGKERQAENTKVKATTVYNT